MFYKLSLCFFLLLLVISRPASSLDIKVNHVTLENGMEVYVIPNHRIPAVMHMVWYKVGGTDDPVGKSGLAHYLEHLMFKGTEKFQDVSAAISSIGGSYNAGTSSDFTVYYELIRKKDLSLVMEIEADRMRNLRITDENAKKEQNIVLEERKMRVDNSPRGLLSEEMESAFYRNNYGRPVVGWENEIHSLNKDDAVNFYNKYYYPNNAVLVVVGDVQFNETINLVKKHYGNIEPGPVNQRFPESEPKHNVDLTVTLKSSEVQEPELFIWYKVPSKITGGNYLAISLVADMLGGGVSSKLYRDLVLSKNLAVDVHAYYDEIVYGGSSIRVGVIPKSGVSLQEIESELDHSIADLVKNGISSEELQNAKYKYKAGKIYNLSDLTSIAYFYGIHLVLDVPIDDIDLSYKKLDDIDVDQINAEMHSMFSDTKLVGYLLPKGDDSNAE